MTDDPWADDPWADDPWADDEPIETPDGTPPRAQQPTVVGHLFASAMHSGSPRGSNLRIGGPNAPTPAHARAAALLRAPTMPGPLARPAGGTPRPAHSVSASSPRIKPPPEIADRGSRPSIRGSSPHVERSARMPTLTRPAITERPPAPPPSRMSVVMLAALIAGGAGAFLVAKATQYATTPQAAALPSAVASAPAAPVAAPMTVTPGAAVATPLTGAAVPGAAVLAPATAPPAAAPAAAVRTAATAEDSRLDPSTAAGAPRVASPATPAASPTRVPASPSPSVARSEDRPADRPSRSRAHPSRAAAAGRPRTEPEPQAEPARREPRADERAADAARPEPARAEPPAVEASPVKAPEPPAPEPPAQAARQEPPQPRPGAIDVAATRAAARAQIGPVQQCYERAKMDDTGLAGTVVARLTISPDGSVASVEIVKSTLGAPQVEACIRQGVLRWHLPRPSGGASASLTYPLVFQ